MSSCPLNPFLKHWPQGFIFIFVMFYPAGVYLSQGEKGSIEYKVKAAYLLNFTRYVEWPVTAFPGREDPYIIGIIGEDPFGSILERTLDGRLSDTRKLVVRKWNDVDEVDRCHILFLGTMDRKKEKEILDTLQGRAVLTVGESEKFIANGGMIRFVMVEESVRFEVNLASSEKAGLDMSSRMLALARKVYLSEK